jgi:hypothetical protein
MQNDGQGSFDTTWCSAATLGLAHVFILYFLAIPLEPAPEFQIARRSEQMTAILRGATYQRPRNFFKLLD